MRLSFRPTQAGTFLQRLNRFVALVESNGTNGHAHIATSGRLHELLVPGARILLEEVKSPGRVTPFNLRAVEHCGIWVSIDAQVPNYLIAKALREQRLQPFANCLFVRSEPPIHTGRLDFLLSEEGRPVYIEVKSVTLVEKMVGLFPDAPTERGRRHLRDLAGLAGEGFRSAVIFVVQREDADVFAPNRGTDPLFAAALRDAVAAGVEAYAYRCYVAPHMIKMTERLPVLV